MTAIGIVRDRGVSSICLNFISCTISKRLQSVLGARYDIIILLPTFNNHRDSTLVLKISNIGLPTPLFSNPAHLRPSLENPRGIRFDAATDSHSKTAENGGSYC